MIKLIFLIALIFSNVNQENQTNQNNHGSDHLHFGFWTQLFQQLLHVYFGRIVGKATVSKHDAHGFVGGYCFGEGLVYAFVETSV